MTQIHLYYKNVMADVIGPEHGITQRQLKDLAQKTTPLIAQLNQDRKAGKVKYRDLPYNQDMAKRVKDLAAMIKDETELLVVLGIGGSALGNVALQSALNPYLHNVDPGQRKGARLYVLDNVDPVQFGSFLDYISDRLEETVFNVISKSGRTAETAAQLMIIRQMLQERLGADGFKSQVIATTDPKEGTLRAIANEFGLKSLEVPDGVGGRFSVLSAVGLFSAAMCGIDIAALLAGARDMDAQVKTEDFFKNPAALNAAIQYHYYQLGKKLSVMMPYCYGLKDLADWYRQLWAESLGKAKDVKGNEVFVGPTPIKALGVTDQHSQVQLYREGPNDKVFTFLEVKDFGREVKIGPAPKCAPELQFLAGKDMGTLINSEKKGTEYALLVNKRPCLTVLFDQVDAYTVGQFIYLYEVSTSIAGALFGVNTYDQPAVELGKDATCALMGHPQYADLLRKIQATAQTDPAYLV